MKRLSHLSTKVKAGRSFGDGNLCLFMAASNRIFVKFLANFSFPICVCVCVYVGLTKFKQKVDQTFVRFRLSSACFDIQPLSLLYIWLNVRLGLRAKQPHTHSVSLSVCMSVCLCLSPPTFSLSVHLSWHQNLFLTSATFGWLAFRNKGKGTKITFLRDQKNFARMRSIFDIPSTLVWFVQTVQPEETPQQRHHGAPPLLLPSPLRPPSNAIHGNCYCWSNTPPLSCSLCETNSWLVLARSLIRNHQHHHQWHRHPRFLTHTTFTHWTNSAPFPGSKIVHFQLVFLVSSKSSSVYGRLRSFVSLSGLPSTFSSLFLIRCPPTALGWTIRPRQTRTNSFAQRKGGS